MRQTSLLVLAMMMVSAICQNPAVPPLGAYNANINLTSTSGISAGGFMAAQFHVAHSTIVIGAGIVAGGPYGCALGQLSQAVSSCMVSPASINLNTLERKAQNLQNIDPLSNLKGQKVYIYDGTEDSVVKPGVGKKGAIWYENFGANLKTVYDVPSQHAWITTNFGNKCNKLGSPYINNCNYDQSLDILSWIYGNLNPAVNASSTNLLRFDQSEFTTSGDSLGDVGYVYVPTSCQNGSVVCKVHVAFHGCKMTLADIGTDFVSKTGLNEIAESNNIIILYPQAKKSLLNPSNPNGCFDWWGYTCNLTPLQTSLKYITQEGVQIKSVYNMVKKLTSSFKPAQQQTVEVSLQE